MSQFPRSLNAELDDLLTAIVRGDSAAPALVGRFDADALVGRADWHGVLSLVADRLRESAEVPLGVRARLREHASRHLAADLLREADMRRALAALREAGIGALLMKGAHLAYCWYERPDLRPRLDTDLLVAFGERAAADEILRGLGYQVPGHTSGELLSYQTPYEKWRDGRRIHVFDVHWRVANPQAFGSVLLYEELVREAVPVPQLGLCAQGLSAAHALLLACVHRVAHHFDSNRLIWLYDIHLIASGLTSMDWERFLVLVERRKVAAVCRRGLDRARQCFETAVPTYVAGDARLSAPASPEATAVYVGPPRRHLGNIISDLQALPSWRNRLQLIREHVFPPRQYMRDVYARSSRAPLPLLYATRAVRGAWRWLERPADDAFGA